MKRTPEPWTIRELPHEEGLAIDSNQLCVANVWGLDDEGRANADLIASAPELLEKLSEAIELLEVDEAAAEVGSDAWVLLKQAKDVIAKAEGKSQEITRGSDEDPW